MFEIHHSGREPSKRFWFKPLWLELLPSTSSGGRGHREDDLLSVSDPLLLPPHSTLRRGGEHSADDRAALCHLHRGHPLHRHHRPAAPESRGLARRFRYRRRRSDVGGGAGRPREGGGEDAGGGVVRVHRHLRS